MKYKKLVLFLYYALLLLLLATRVNATADPPLVFRLLYIAAVISPSLIDEGLSYPAIISLFYIISVNGFAYSFMPYNLSLYIVISFFVLLLCFLRRGAIQKDRSERCIPFFIVLFAIYVFTIDLIHSSFIFEGSLFYNNLQCFVLISFFLLVIKGHEDAALSQIPLSFAIITIVLCFAFLSNRDQYIFQEYEGFERTGWTDPNYFGMVIGMGTMCSLIKLFSIKERENMRVGDIVIYCVSLGISIPVLLLNASRGAVLAVLLGFLALFIFAKVSVVYKILVLAIGLVLLSILYSNHFFDLLLLRIEHDDGYGSERTLIWTSKLRAYSNGSFIEMVFGYGNHGGLAMGWNGMNKGFHNDFVGYLVDYGIIGLGFLLYMLIYPLKLVPRDSNQRHTVVVLLVYLAACMLTLEPFVSGILAFFVFYLYAFLTAQHEKHRASI